MFALGLSPPLLVLTAEESSQRPERVGMLFRESSGLAE
jgi:hypothetical protein